MALFSFGVTTVSRISPKDSQQPRFQPSTTSRREAGRAVFRNPADYTPVLHHRAGRKSRRLPPRSGKSATSKNHRPLTLFRPESHKRAGIGDIKRNPRAPKPCDYLRSWPMPIIGERAVRDDSIRKAPQPNPDRAFRCSSIDPNKKLRAARSPNPASTAGNLLKNETSGG